MTTLNEQMREKPEAVAKRLVSKWIESCRELRVSPPGKLEQLERIFAASLKKQAQEAHAAGRQEILDRLPSKEEDALERLATLKRFPAASSRLMWESAIDWFKSRLTGESK